MKVAIIGSGIVGLTIAYTLSKENINITIFEKEKDSLSHFAMAEFIFEKYYLK